MSVFLLHDRGGSPDGSIVLLEYALKRLRPRTPIFRPGMIHRSRHVGVQESIEAFADLMVPKHAVIVGLGLGGFVAARLQESARSDLDVICINTPTSADGIRLTSGWYTRIALCNPGAALTEPGAKFWEQVGQPLYLDWLDDDGYTYTRVAPLLVEFLESRKANPSLLGVELKDEVAEDRVVE